MFTILMLFLWLFKVRVDHVLIYLPVLCIDISPTGQSLSIFLLEVWLKSNGINTKCKGNLIYSAGIVWLSKVEAILKEVYKLPHKWEQNNKPASPWFVSVTRTTPLDTHLYTLIYCFYILQSINMSNPLIPVGSTTPSNFIMKSIR